MSVVVGAGRVLVGDARLAARGDHEHDPVSGSVEQAHGAGREDGLVVGMGMNEDHRGHERNSCCGRRVRA